MVFLAVMYGRKSWTIKKATHQRIDAFDLWCWRKLLRVPWTARRSNQTILKKINPEYSLEELMLKLCSNTLATWCKELTHWKRPWCWERLRARGEGRDKGWDSWMVSLTQWTWVWANSGRQWRTGSAAVHGVTKSWTWLNKWTITTRASHALTSQNLTTVAVEHFATLAVFSKQLSPPHVSGSSG